MFKKLVAKVKKVFKGFKKHDALRIVGEPVLVAGHVGMMITGGVVAKAALAIGAVAMIAWVGFEIADFARKRKEQMNRNVCFDAV